MREISAILLLCVDCNAATWYVRPLVSTNWSGGVAVSQAGIYGAQDGTSYANAWNGLKSVVWGVSGVNSGDTLYICGTHVAKYDSGQCPNTDSFLVNLAQSGITIRGDYPGDPSIVFGGCIDTCNTYLWAGPDANGVYRSALPSLGNASWAVQFEITNGIPYRLKQESTTTWTGDAGSCYFIENATNYVKLSTGTAPSATNVALPGFGWTLMLTNGTSNVVFQSIRFIDGGIGWSYPDGTTFLGITNITFANCVLTDGSCNLGNSYFHVRGGHDYWRIINCEIARTGEGIQADLQSLSRGAWGWLVFGNYIHDVDTPEYPTAADPHAIGVQGGCSWTIVSNRIERTGAAIEFWTSSQAQSNNVFAYNFIKDIRVQTNGTGGGGIVITSPSAGLGNNVRIYGNVIVNVGLLPDDPDSDWEGAGIDIGPKDYTEILNNTIVNPRIGLQLRVNEAPVNAKVENNIVYSPSRNFINFAQTGSTNTMVIDYNLFFTNAVLADPFHNIVAGQNTHSVFADPQFVSASPTSALDFRIQRTSPAIDAGTSVGLTTDFLGNPIVGAPDIGAFEYLQSANVGTLNVGTLRGP